MKKLALFLALLATPLAAQAQDFSEGSEARSWNLFAESPARFEARVVDVVCEITGNCAENCDDGTRQLALLRAADGVLVYPNKNGQPAFTGAADELLPYCGMDVEVDGLILEDEFVGAANVYLLQRIRAVGEEDWVRANAWTRNWAERNPDAGDGQWFRNDPRILATIADSGYLGLGLTHEEAWEAIQ